jgi:uncharacterized SAM-binding protein YcdF (DUF218 family)
MPDSQYAIILGATAYGWEPSPVFRERIRQGVRLYQEGKVAKLIFTGGPGSPPQARVAEAYARSLGLPEQDLLTEVDSMTTFENILYARALIPENSRDRVVLVSDPLHLRRASLIAHDLGLKVTTSPAETSRFKSPYGRARFLLRETLAYGYYLIKRIF